MLKTVTYDDATHVVAPLEPTDDMVIAAPFGQSNAYRKMITAAPPFTSLPNPDLDLIERVLDMADGMSRFGSEEYAKIQEAIAALKRIKEDV